MNNRLAVPYNFPMDNISDHKKFRKVQDDAYDLFLRKNADYGSAFRDHGAVGMIVRAGEKLKRLMTITNTSIIVNNDETLRDTIVDLANCCTLATMMLDDNNKTEEETK